VCVCSISEIMDVPSKLDVLRNVAFGKFQIARENPIARTIPNNFKMLDNV